MIASQRRALFIMVLLPLVLLSCSPAISHAQASANDQIAAIVNGDNITVSDWINKMQSLRAQDFIASTSPLQFKNETAGQIALQSLIFVKLLYQFAQKTSLMPTEADIDSDMKLAEQNPSIAQALASKQLTDQQLKEQVKLERTLYNVATVNERCTPDEIKEYYDKHPEKWGTPETWRLSMIQLSNETDANKAMAKLKAGTPFATVASEMSVDTATKVKGGDVGYVVANNPNLPQFIKDAVSKLKVGEYSPIQKEVVNGQTVYYIIQLVAKKDMTVLPFSQVEPQVERMALLAKAGGMAAVQKKIADFEKVSSIVISLPGYQQMMPSSGAQTK
jgi:foldase protein PrsA